MTMSRESLPNPQDILTEIAALPPGASVMFLGATDTGKSTLLREALNAARERGLSVAVLDLDVGQGEGGPPGTINALYSEERHPVRSVREVPHFASYFIGAVTPARHLLDLCLGASRLCAAIRARGADLILVDTCGYVAGSVGRAFKRRLVEAVSPDMIVALQKGAEIESVLESLRGTRRPVVLRAAVDERVGRKTPSTRATRRAARFLAAFEEAKPVTWSFDDVALVGASFAGGEPLSLAATQMIAKALSVPVMYAADLQDGSAVVVVRQDKWDAAALPDLAATLRRKPLLVIPASHYARLLVGIVDPGGIHRGIGTIERIDFERRQLTVLTRCHPGVAAQVWFGHLRVRPDGRELGDLRPGEV